MLEKNTYCFGACAGVLMRYHLASGLVEMVLKWEKIGYWRCSGYVHTKGIEVVLPAINAVHGDESTYSVFS